MLGSFGINMFSGMFGKFVSSEASTQHRDVGTSIDNWILNGKLQFHPVHGKEIMLLENKTVAQRSETTFENSVVFSHRPVSVNEVIAVEIVKMTKDFCGTLKIGFTTVNPATFQDQPTALSSQNLKDMAGMSLKGVLLHPLTVGSIICYMVNYDGVILHGVNGEEAGVFASGIDTSKPLWAVLEAYGAVQAFKLVDKPFYFTFNRPSTVGLDENNLNDNALQLINTRRARIAAQNRNCCSSFFSFFSARGNDTIGPLQDSNSVSADSTVSPSPSPAVPTYFTPVLREPSEQELCIICTEREKNTAFARCGHVCMCHPCAESFFKRRPSTAPSHQTRRGRGRGPKPLCPVCRNPITSLMRIYYT